jgi:opacity protein-like surface antigen
MLSGGDMRVGFLALFLAAGLALSATTSFADRGDKSVEASLNYGTEAFGGLGGQIGVSTGFGYGLSRNLEARADLSYYRSAINQDEYNVSGTRIPIDLGVRYYYPLSQIDRNLTAYGQGAVEISFDDWVPSEYSSSRTETRFGVVLGGGAEYALAPHYGALLQLQYHVVKNSYLSTGIGMAYHF